MSIEKSLVGWAASLNGELGIGLIGCPDLVPDLCGIADAIPDALKELLECGDDQSEDSNAAQE